jgi:large subunit ribosomal protein L22
VGKKDIEVNVDETTEVKTSPRRKSNRPAVLTKKEKKSLSIGNDEGRAIAKFVRISPRKVKIVMDLIRNKDVKEAFGILKYTQKSASPILYKLVKSAAANAENKALDLENLYVAEGYANQGPSLKRIRARAQGRAARILKRTSHITLVVKERK